ncbi:MAG: metal-dependent transcriptional regulator [Maledivibacter sp.]|jgi:Mn-dependent DtxR family transcriptional regulator|nr:metal-dependent transcriptional regulator [Maledivibacter sp.]
MEKLTFVMENYLEAIYELSNKGDSGARLSDIAKRLGVTKASANSAMSTLAQKGLISNEKYKEIFLTPKGKILSEQTSHKHHVIRHFFVEVLKVDLKIADGDACAIEHVISNEAVLAMEDYLSNQIIPD